MNQIETGYAKRILELLEPIVGRDNLRASVTADIDFSQSEATSEEFKPNQGADAERRDAQPADHRAVGRRRRRTAERRAGRRVEPAAGRRRPRR